ncbi:MAG: Holliday junction branch migration protein RuvA [Planctomycetota bacterium]
MLNHLRGKLFTKAHDEAVVEVNGVGYSLRIPGSTYDALPKEGGDCFLYVHLSRREEGDTLYGFATPQERRMFHLLISVNRVGPALALAVLSSIPVGRLAEAIKSRDIKTLSTLKGLGRTTAERLVVDLASKVDELVGGDRMTVSPVMKDAVDALEALGIDRLAASRAVSDVVAELSEDSEQPDTREIIVKALHRYRGGKK